MIQHITIIGSGPAGYTAAIYGSRAGLNVQCITGDNPGGQLTTTTIVENYSGFSSIFGKDLMENMRLQATKCGATLIQDYIINIKKENNCFIIEGQNMVYKSYAVIIATGANPRFLQLPNEKNLLGYGVSTCATCDGALFKNKDIAVVGGGNTAMEEAMYLSRYARTVYIIHRRNTFRADYAMQEKLKASPNIIYKMPFEVKAIHGSQNSGLHSIDIAFQDKMENILVSGMFLAIGQTPNTQHFASLLTLDEEGYILPQGGGVCTSVEGIFACGDVVDKIYRQAITSAGDGCRAAIDAKKFLEKFSLC